MGQAKTFKKQRKYARQAMYMSLQQFKEEFNSDDFVKPCPKFIPKIIWNILINILVKK
ncbi:MAG: hypothetical protein WC823_00180 [Parcubacteria group bacterium]|jgi:hypothetical protein